MPSERHPRQTPLPTGFGFGPPRERAQRPATRLDGRVPDEATLLAIGEVAEQYGVTLRTLRFYEQKGLIAPKRMGARRLYDVEQLARLRHILAGKRLGLPLHEIERLLSAEASALTPTEISAQIAHLEQQRSEIDAAIAELRAMLPKG